MTLRFLDWTTGGWRLHYWDEEFWGEGGERTLGLCILLLKYEISTRYLGEDMKWLIANILNINPEFRREFLGWK